jgi:hypothetical protein
MGFRRQILTLAFLAGALFLAACGDDDSGPTTGTPAPDFALTDVNPNSATHDSTISPRDYREKISAWYFGHAT